MKRNISLAALLATTLLLGAFSDSSNAQSKTELAAMQQRLAALEAESQIRDKLQSYMAVLSAADWDNYINYFTKDAKLLMTEGTRQGRADIKERMSTASIRLGKAAEGRPKYKRADLLSIIQVKVHGNTTDAKSRFTFLSGNAEGGFEVSGSGLYIDTWALEDGEWRISSRQVDYDLLRSAPQPPAQPK
jgi:3-phenylpropionate/cinnamic acid dioxygenase small subunit